MDEDINGYQIISDLPIDLPILFGGKLWITMVNWFQNLEQSYFGTGPQMATHKKRARLGGYESKLA